jgi:hypothetical protein
MCQSQAQGGKRCAAHTRPAYQNVIGGPVGETAADTSQADFDAAMARRLNKGYEAVVAYASTPSGMNDVKRDHDLLVDRYAQHPSTTAAQEQARQETLSNLRTAVTAATTIRAAEAETRTAVAPAVRRSAAQARQEQQARQARAEEVIWLVNHGYDADARFEVDGFRERYAGAPAPEAAAPTLMDRISRRKPDPENEERRAHAERVMTLILDGHHDDAKEEARRFGVRYRTGYAPTMSADMAALRAPRR